MDWSRSWSSSHRACGHAAWACGANRSSCSSRIAVPGTHSTSGEAKPLGTAPTVCAEANERGPYTLQAAIAACHARAGSAPTRRTGTRSWLSTASSPGRCRHRSSSSTARSWSPWPPGPPTRLRLVDVLVATGTLERYHLLAGVRGDLLDRMGRHDEAADEFERAARLASNHAERALLSAGSAQAGPPPTADGPERRALTGGEP